MGIDTITTLLSHQFQRDIDGNLFVDITHNGPVNMNLSSLNPTFILPSSDVNNPIAIASGLINIQESTIYNGFLLPVVSSDITVNPNIALAQGSGALNQFEGVAVNGILADAIIGQTELISLTIGEGSLYEYDHVNHYFQLTITSGKIQLGMAQLFDIELLDASTQTTFRNTFQANSTNPNNVIGDYDGSIPLGDLTTQNGYISFDATGQLLKLHGELDAVAGIRGDIPAANFQLNQEALDAIAGLTQIPQSGGQIISTSNFPVLTGVAIQDAEVTIQGVSFDDGAIRFNPLIADADATFDGITATMDRVANSIIRDNMLHCVSGSFSFGPNYAITGQQLKAGNQNIVMTGLMSTPPSAFALSSVKQSSARVTVPSQSAYIDKNSKIWVDASVQFARSKELLKKITASLSINVQGNFTAVIDHLLHLTAINYTTSSSVDSWLIVDPISHAVVGGSITLNISNGVSQLLNITSGDSIGTDWTISSVALNLDGTNGVLLYLPRGAVVTLTTNGTLAGNSSVFQLLVSFAQNAKYDYKLVDMNAVFMFGSSNTNLKMEPMYPVNANLHANGSIAFNKYRNFENNMVTLNDNLDGHMQFFDRMPSDYAGLSGNVGFDNNAVLPAPQGASFYSTSTYLMQKATVNMDPVSYEGGMHLVHDEVSYPTVAGLFARDDNLISTTNLSYVNKILNGGVLAFGDIELTVLDGQDGSSLNSHLQNTNGSLRLTQSHVLIQSIDVANNILVGDITILDGADMQENLADFVADIALSGSISGSLPTARQYFTGSLNVDIHGDVVSGTLTSNDITLTINGFGRVAELVNAGGLINIFTGASFQNLMINSDNTFTGTLQLNRSSGANVTFNGNKLIHGEIGSQFLGVQFSTNLPVQFNSHVKVDPSLIDNTTDLSFLHGSNLSGVENPNVIISSDIGNVGDIRIDDSFDDNMFQYATGADVPTIHALPTLNQTAPLDAGLYKELDLVEVINNNLDELFPQTSVPNPLVQAEVDLGSNIHFGYDEQNNVYEIKNKDANKVALVLDAGTGDTRMLQHMGFAPNYVKLGHLFDLHSNAYVVTTDLNDSFMLSDDNYGNRLGPSSITLTAGQYTGAELATHLQSVIDTALGSNSGNITISYDPVIGLTYVNNSSTLTYFFMADDDHVFADLIGGNDDPDTVVNPDNDMRILDAQGSSSVDLDISWTSMNFYTILTNNQLLLDGNAIQIDDGDYNGDELVAALNSAFDTALGAGKLTATFNAGSDLLTIANTDTSTHTLTPKPHYSLYVDLGFGGTSFAIGNGESETSSFSIQWTTTNVNTFTIGDGNRAFDIVTYNKITKDDDQESVLPVVLGTTGFSSRYTAQSFVDTINQLVDGNDVLVHFSYDATTEIVSATNTSALATIVMASSASNPGDTLYSNLFDNSDPSFLVRKPEATVVTVPSQTLTDDESDTLVIPGANYSVVNGSITIPTQTLRDDYDDVLIIPGGIFPIVNGAVTIPGQTLTDVPSNDTFVIPSLTIIINSIFSHVPTWNGIGTGLINTTSKKLSVSFNGGATFQTILFPDLLNANNHNLNSYYVASQLQTIINEAHSSAVTVTAQGALIYIKANAPVVTIQPVPSYPAFYHELFGDASTSTTIQPGDTLTVSPVVLFRIATGNDQINTTVLGQLTLSHGNFSNNVQTAFVEPFAFYVDKNQFYIINPTLNSYTISQVVGNNLMFDAFGSNSNVVIPSQIASFLFHSKGSGKYRIVHGYNANFSINATNIYIDHPISTGTDYTGSELARELNTQLQKQVATNKLSVSFNVITNKFTIVNTDVSNAYTFTATNPILMDLFGAQPFAVSADDSYTGIDALSSNIMITKGDADMYLGATLYTLKQGEYTPEMLAQQLSSLFPTVGFAPVANGTVKSDGLTITMANHDSSPMELYVSVNFPLDDNGEVFTDIAVPKALASGAIYSINNSDASRTTVVLASQRDARIGALNPPMHDDPFKAMFTAVMDGTYQLKSLALKRHGTKIEGKSTLWSASFESTDDSAIQYDVQNGVTLAVNMINPALYDTPVKSNITFDAQLRLDDVSDVLVAGVDISNPTNIRLNGQLGAPLEVGFGGTIVSDSANDNLLIDNLYANGQNKPDGSSLVLLRMLQNTEVDYNDFFLSNGPISVQITPLDGQSDIVGVISYDLVTDPLHLLENGSPQTLLPQDLPTFNITGTIDLDPAANIQSFVTEMGGVVTIQPAVGHPLLSFDLVNSLPTAFESTGKLHMVDASVSNANVGLQIARANGVVSLKTVLTITADGEMVDEDDPVPSNVIVATGMLQVGDMIRELDITAVDAYVLSSVLNNGMSQQGSFSSLEDVVNFMHSGVVDFVDNDFSNDWSIGAFTTATKFLANTDYGDLDANSRALGLPRNRKQMRILIAHSSEIFDNNITVPDRTILDNYIIPEAVVIPGGIYAVVNGSITIPDQSLTDAGGDDLTIIGGTYPVINGSVTIPGQIVIDDDSNTFIIPTLTISPSTFIFPDNAVDVDNKVSMFRYGPELWAVVLYDNHMSRITQIPNHALHYNMYAFMRFDEINALSTGLSHAMMAGMADFEKVVTANPTNLPAPRTYRRTPSAPVSNNVPSDSHPVDHQNTILRLFGDNDHTALLNVASYVKMDYYDQLGNELEDMNIDEGLSILDPADVWDDDNNMIKVPTVDPNQRPSWVMEDYMHEFGMGALMDADVRDSVFSQPVSIYIHNSVWYHLAAPTYLGPTTY